MLALQRRISRVSLSPKHQHCPPCESHFCKSIDPSYPLQSGAITEAAVRATCRGFLMRSMSPSIIQNVQTSAGCMACPDLRERPFRQKHSPGSSFDEDVASVVCYRREQLSTRPPRQGLWPHLWARPKEDFLCRANVCGEPSLPSYLPSWTACLSNNSCQVIKVC